MASGPMIVWGPELSPFLLKLESMLAYAGVEFRRLPRDGSRLENLRTARKVSAARKNRTALRPPANDELDEFPLVPYLLTPEGEVLYDTSALAEWLDARRPRGTSPLLPEAPALAFATRLIDEAFDEFGLYLVHHNRWKVAAGDNDHPGRRLAKEYSKLLPPGVSRIFAGWFERRQVRRLPYLFSVAPEGYRASGVSSSLTPPSRAGFPATHDLLDYAWLKYVAALERALEDSRFLLGDRFTLADASAYGQLAMNLSDPAAADRLAENAPRVCEWLLDIRSGKHRGSSGTIDLRAELAPLVGIIVETFVPLMRANQDAFSRVPSGRAIFNEEAFDANQNLFEGELLGEPYKTVIKTFQVRVWRDLVARWKALPNANRSALEALAPQQNLKSLFN